MDNSPIHITLDHEVNDKTSMQKGFKALVSHVKKKRTSLGIDNNETNVVKKWNNLKLLIFNYKEAHIECRELNNFFDRLLTIIALIMSFITTFLLAIKDIQTDTNPYIYIIECVTSGIATLMVGLTNAYDNAGKREIHNNVVIKLRNLALTTQQLSELEENRNDLVKYQECYSKFIEALGTTYIYEEVRKKYGLDKKYLLGFN
tara:strand:+ start:138 stop:746 length:609 start_codon:yes stop_codon:yes gene_type:complete